MAASLRKVNDSEIYETGPAQRPCDPLLFFEALLSIDSKSGSAAAKRTASGSTSHKPTYCMANVLDTITAVNGEPRVWVFTQHDGSITQKKHYDRATVMTSWRQHCASLGAVCVTRAGGRQAALVAEKLPLRTHRGALARQPQRGRGGLVASPRTPYRYRHCHRSLAARVPPAYPRSTCATCSAELLPPQLPAVLHRPANGRRAGRAQRR